MSDLKHQLVIQAFRSAVEEAMETTEFGAKLAELLKPNTPTKAATELFKKLLYSIPKQEDSK